MRGVPYDRPLTTMAGFELCPRCAAEYEDPADRRFHAQPNACPECGPTLALGDLRGDAALRAAVAALREGAVVAVKGIGGYHLACLAAREPAVAALRARKHREDKPFAVMVRDVAAARALVSLTDEEAALLAGRDRPIVLAPRRSDAPVAASVAPRSADLGVLLPYSPLHHLLLADAGEPLVMTSGNVSDEPIAHEDEDALARLAGIADLVLRHDRPIHTRTDDSVLRAVPRRRPLLLRRSRGFVPDSLPLPGDGRPLLACGAELKSTFCVAKGARAWVGHHIGDLKSYEVLQAYEAGIEHFERLFAVVPEVVAHDEHPDYLSTRYALARERRRDRRGPAPPRPPRGVPGRARRDRPRGRRDLRRVGLRARRQRLGRRDPGRRPARLRAPGAPLAGAAARRRPRGRAAVADGGRVAARGGLGRSAAGPGTPIRSPSSSAPASRRRGRRAWGGCSTPSPRSAGCATR